MVSTVDLRMLSQWCSLHLLSWWPVQTDKGDSAVMLRAVMRTGPNLILMEDGGDWQLVDEWGATMASASDIRALLDAVEAGIAQPRFSAPDGYRQPFTRDVYRASLAG